MIIVVAAQINLDKDGGGGKTDNLLPPVVWGISAQACANMPQSCGDMPQSCANMPQSCGDMPQSCADMPQIQ